MYHFHEQNKKDSYNNNKLFIDSSTENIAKTEAYIKTLTEEITMLKEERKSLEKNPLKVHFTPEHKKGAA